MNADPMSADPMTAPMISQPIRALRAADPRPRDRGVFADGPLDRRAADELQALRDGGAAGSSRPSPRYQPRGVLRTALLTSAPLAAAGVALLLVLSISGTQRGPGDGFPDGQSSSSGAVTLVPVHPGDADAGPVVLAGIASVAEVQPAMVPREDQFVYLHTAGGGLDLTDRDAPVYVTDGERQVWVPQSADAEGLIEQGGSSSVLNPQLGGAEDPATYAALSALPRDPAALLQYVRSQEQRSAGTDKPVSDAEVFQALGGLLQDSLTPPGVSASIYRAAALLPGVSQVPDAVDAVGRSGVGLAVQDDVVGVRYEWVLDARTSTFLGSRAYLVRDSAWGVAGTLVTAHAVLDRAVVDRAGQLPVGDERVRRAGGSDT